MREPVLAFVGLGANLGDPFDALQTAIDRMHGLVGVTLVAQSPLYRSAPVDASGPDFINAVVALRTTNTAPALLLGLQGLEVAGGRLRPYRNAPRTLDLDLLLFGEGCIASNALTVPHPRMWERAFVLHPLAEIAPLRVPVEALARVQDQAIVRCDAG